MKKFAFSLVLFEEYHIEKSLNSFIGNLNQSLYDLFIIGYDLSDNSKKIIKNYYRKKLLPIKNVIFFDKANLADVYNVILDSTSDYEYLLKTSENVSFLNYDIASYKKPSKTPDQYGANPGAVKVASFTMGSRQASPVRKKTNIGVLEYIDKYQKEHNIGICSIASNDYGLPFGSIVPALQLRKYMGMPFVSNGIISAKHYVFEKNGYYNDKIDSSCLDIEYSQRAVKNGINIGYFPNMIVFKLKNNSNKNIVHGLKSDNMYKESISAGFRKNDIKNFKDINKELKQNDLLELTFN